MRQWYSHLLMSRGRRNQAIAEALRAGLVEAGLPEHCIQTVPAGERESLLELLKLEGLIDLCIPRGGEGLIRFVAENARIPVVKHYKGEWAGQFIVLQPWQQFRLGSIFGWVHVETGLRRFRAAYNEVPRKNGKSADAAGIALYKFAADGEVAAEVYIGATSEKMVICTRLMVKNRIVARLRSGACISPLR